MTKINMSTATSYTIGVIALISCIVSIILTAVIHSQISFDQSVNEESFMVPGKTNPVQRYNITQNWFVEKHDGMTAIRRSSGGLIAMGVLQLIIAGSLFWLLADGEWYVFFLPMMIGVGALFNFMAGISVFRLSPEKMSLYSIMAATTPIYIIQSLAIVGACVFLFMTHRGWQSTSIDSLQKKAAELAEKQRVANLEKEKKVQNERVRKHIADEAGRAAIQEYEKKQQLLQNKPNTTFELKGDQIANRRTNITGSEKGQAAPVKVLPTDKPNTFVVQPTTTTTAS